MLCMFDVTILARIMIAIQNYNVLPGNYDNGLALRKQAKEEKSASKEEE